MPAEIAILGPVNLRYLADLLDRDPDDLPVGMDGTQLIPLIRCLVGQGRRVLVLTLGAGESGEMIFESGGLRICIGPYRARRRARDLFAVERRYLVETLERERPRVVHANWTYEFALAAQASRLPHVISAHDAPLRILYFDRSPYRVLRTVMAFQVIRRAPAIVISSPYTGRHLRRWLGYRGRFDLIPNALPDGVLARHAVSPDPARPSTFACCSNGWGRLKNVTTALQAFRLVRQRIPDARLLLFGTDHGPGEAAERWAAARGLTGGVTFRGWQPHDLLLDAFQRDFDILVHPSLDESFGVTLAEAMSLGLPVIGGRDSGAVPWTLDEGRSGILTDVRSPEALAESMVDIASAPDKAAALGRIAAQSARERFSTDHVTAAYVDCYDRAVEAHR